MSLTMSSETFLYLILRTKPMPTIKFIKENPDIVKKDLKKRNDPEKLKWIDLILKKHEQYLDLLKKEQELRHKRNVISEEINQLQKDMKLLKDNPQKMMDKQKELMSKNFKMMKHNIKPMLFTFIPLIIIFGWLRTVYTPLGKIILGLSWFWVYLISAIVFSMIIRKLLKIY